MSNLPTPTFPPTDSQTTLRVTCPHCGQVLHIVPVQTHATPAPAPLQQAPQSLWSHTLRHAVQTLFSTRNAAASTPPAVPSGSRWYSTLATHRPWLVLTAIVAMLLIVIGLFFWEGQHRPALAPPGIPAPGEVARPDTAGAQAAIRDTLTRYNAAETEAAALLRIDPLLPYLAPEGILATRRAAELAERQRRNAPHRSILVRWALGDITVDGDQAIAVTQETWSNQEAGAVAPEQATVRVTYRLRWDAATARWLIVESEQLQL